MKLFMVSIIIKLSSVNGQSFILNPGNFCLHYKISLKSVNVNVLALTDLLFDKDAGNSIPVISLKLYNLSKLGVINYTSVTGKFLFESFYNFVKVH